MSSHARSTIPAVAAAHAKSLRLVHNVLVVPAGLCCQGRCAPMKSGVRYLPYADRVGDHDKHAKRRRILDNRARRPRVQVGIGRTVV